MMDKFKIIIEKVGVPEFRIEHTAIMFDMTLQSKVDDDWRKNPQAMEVDISYTIYNEASDD